MWQTAIGRLHDILFAIKFKFIKMTGFDRDLLDFLYYQNKNCTEIFNRKINLEISNSFAGLDYKWTGFPWTYCLTKTRSMASSSNKQKNVLSKRSLTKPMKMMVKIFCYKLNCLEKGFQCWSQSKTRKVRCCKKHVSPKP